MAGAIALVWTTAGAEEASTTVTAPPGSTTTIKTPETPGSTGTTVTTPDTRPSDPDAVTDDADQPATTNIEIEPPAVNNTVVTPPPVEPLAPAASAYQNGYDRAPVAARPVVGAGVLLGGGVQDFTQSNVRGMTGTAGYWNARLVFGTRQPVGLEAAYIGSAQSINALGLASDAVLVSNGAEGAVRINIPIVRRATLMEPFVFGGAGWSRYHIARSAQNMSSLASNDDILEIPYGAGFAASYRNFMVDARFTYRSTFYNDMLRSTGDRLDNWSAGGQLGFEF
jgi:hypothetical protein